MNRTLPRGRPVSSAAMDRAMWEPSASTTPISKPPEPAPPTRMPNTLASASGAAKAVMRAERFRIRRRMSVTATRSVVIRRSVPEAPCR